MNSASRPAVAGGQPVRTVPLPYGRHQLYDGDEEAVLRALRSGTLTSGTEIARFESALAQRCGVRHAVTVANGTAALHVALAGIGVGDGDEVITTPLTFVASANAAVYTGATPAFADIGDDRCLDPASTAAAVTARTRAVVAVDYSGLPADVDALRAAMPREIPMVVDGAHSLGGSLRGRPTGSLATVTTLSFHPVKQITSGEGGACLTDDDGIADRMRRLRNHGMTSTAAERSGSRWRYDVTLLGHNYRMTELQAALGSSQLLHLDSVVRRRTTLAQLYDEALADIPGVVRPRWYADRESAWHLYAVEIDEREFGMARDDVIDGLRAEGIEATLHYPAVHTLAVYRERGYAAGIAPRAESMCARLLTLPLFPAMSEEDLADVVLALHRLHAWSRHSAAV